MIIFGIKCPSTTSTWTQLQPANSTALTLLTQRCKFWRKKGETVMSVLGTFALKAMTGGIFTYSFFTLNSFTGSLTWPYKSSLLCWCYLIENIRKAWSCPADKICCAPYHNTCPSEQPISTTLRVGDVDVENENNETSEQNDSNPLSLWVWYARTNQELP